jgi:hypothetical protein
MVMKRTEEAVLLTSLFMLFSILVYAALTTVTFTTPTTGSILTDNVTLNVTTNELAFNVTYRFINQSNLSLANITVPNSSAAQTVFATSFNTTALRDGVYSILAIADNGTAQVNTSANVTINNTLPLFLTNITSPTQLEVVNGTIDLNVNLSRAGTQVNLTLIDAKGNLRFNQTINNATTLQDFFNGSVNTSNLQNGNYTFRATGTNGSVINTSNSSFTINNPIELRAAILSPANNSNLTNNVSVNVSIWSLATQVNFSWINSTGSDLNTSVFTNSTEVQRMWNLSHFNTTQVRNGNYTLRVLITNGTHTNTSNLSVNVNNSIQNLSLQNFTLTSVLPAGGSKVGINTTFRTIAGNGGLQVNYSFLNATGHREVNISIANTSFNQRIFQNVLNLINLTNGTGTVLINATNGTVVLNTSFAFTMDNQLPVIANVSPTGVGSATVNTSQFINASVRDDDAIANVTAQVTLPNGTIITVLLNNTGTNFSSFLTTGNVFYSANFIFPINGFIEYFVIATDESGNVASDFNTISVLADTTSPVLTVSSPAAADDVCSDGSASTTLTVTCTDNTGFVGSAFYDLFPPGGGSVANVLSRVGSTNTFSSSVTFPDDQGVYSTSVGCTDAAGNSGSSGFGIDGVKGTSPCPSGGGTSSQGGGGTSTPRTNFGSGPFNPPEDDSYCGEPTILIEGGERTIVGVVGEMVDPTAMIELPEPAPCFKVVLDTTGHPSDGDQILVTSEGMDSLPGNIPALSQASYYVHIRTPSTVSDDISAASVICTVQKNWMEEIGITSEEIGIERWTCNSKWVEQPTSVVSETGSTVTVRADMPGLGLLGVTTKLGPPQSSQSAPAPEDATPAPVSDAPSPLTAGDLLAGPALVGSLAAACAHLKKRKLKKPQDSGSETPKKPEGPELKKPQKPEDENTQKGKTASGSTSSTIEL